MAYVNKMLEMIGALVNILQLIVEIRMELLRNLYSMSELRFLRNSLSRENFREALSSTSVPTIHILRAILSNGRYISE